MEQKKKRRFSVEDDFMKSRTNVQLYGFMRCLSTTLPQGEKWKEYLLVSTFNKSKKVIMNVCGIGSAKTLKRHIDTLIAAELLEEGEIEVKDKKYPCYFFPQDFTGAYKLIDKTLLRVLVGCLSPLTIKIYLYLLNRNSLKNNYEFTIQELKEAFGYSPSTKTCDLFINDGLKVLKQLKIIDYDEIMKDYFDNKGNAAAKPVKVLTFIAVQCPDNLDKEFKNGQKSNRGQDKKATEGWTKKQPIQNSISKQ